MLAKTVTKTFPTENTVGMHLVLTDDARPDLGDGEQVVIDQDFSENFSPGEGIVNEVRDAIGGKIQAAIDEYKRKKTIYDAPTYETARTQIDNALTL